jgi:NAD(P)-dependent dehydrogenase (short-subunit alcohol dehydrogenase family)
MEFGLAGRRCFVTVAVITFLASERASYVTGTMIPVDGGFLRLDLK